MIPVIAEEKCPQCGLTLNHFGGGIRYCANHGQLDRKHQSPHCPKGCPPQLTIRIGDRRHCNQCASDW